MPCGSPDRSFIVGLERDPRDAVSVLTLADALGLTAIAEGVETAAQDGQLRELGCGYAQGYRFARPAFPEQMGPLIG